MTVMHEVEFSYEVGEEVVFHLPAGVGASTGTSWTIGEIVERVVRARTLAYTVRFRDGEDTRTTEVAESAIEGTA